MSDDSSPVPREYPVNDQSGPFEVTTNGTHKVTDAEPPKPIDQSPESVNGRSVNRQAINGPSVDQRLDALMETIRAWDWRAASVGAISPSAEAVAGSVSHPITPPSTEVRGDSEPLTHAPFPVPSIADTQPVEVQRKPRHARAQPLPPENRAVAVEDATLSSEPTPGPPVGIGPIELEDNEEPTSLSEPVLLPPIGMNPIALEDHEEPNSWTDLVSEPELELGRDRRPGRLRSHSRAQAISSHPWFQPAVLGLAAIVFVLLVVAGIHLVTKGSGSGSGSGSGDSSATTATTASSSTHHSNFVAPISTAQLTNYQGYAETFQEANVVATKAFASAGSAPKPAQLTAASTAYGSALNLYDFQLHFIQWPASMQTAIVIDHAQLKSLMSFLQTLNEVSATGTGPWLSQLHDRASTAETADNHIREDLGLPTSSSFP